ncbi:MAG TPA: urea ABC transporter ATP-binding subunit UrtE [Egibacteraceae bacterium]|jgi:urea transport system ATP-binding protein|nr:urea ABC transporter ATP-binding subunit UrtE [Egibacteraceae bacterium]
MLDITGLCARYGTTQVLFDVDVSVPRKGIVCLLGRNGAGKTTLLDAVMGVRPASAGTIRLDGADVTRWPPHRRASSGIAYVPQGQTTFPQLTVRENLQVVLESCATRRRGAVDDVIDTFPVLATILDRPAGLLSGGQRQQLAMGRALVVDPRILLLDEPTEGIQPSVVQHIARAIVALHADRGVTVLLAEQAVDFALAISDRYAVLDAGRLIEEGSCAEMDVDRLHEALAI